MDRLVYTALNSLQLLQQAQSVTATNLANVGTTGFRKDTSAAFASVYAERDQKLEPRAWASIGESAFNDMPGELINTNDPMNIAVNGIGYMLVEPPSGEIALSRRGDLRRDLEGFLKSGDGAFILDEGGQRIQIPDYKSIEFGNGGTISIMPLNAGAEEFEPVLVGRIGLMDTTDVLLRKGTDAFIRPRDGSAPQASGNMSIKQNFIERSNVNPTDELIASIELARLFEVNVRMLKTAERLDQAGAGLLRID